ncbi:MAG TPA: hypothetical protein VMB48_00065 [Steroidobacteraceae bacterium]|nr:hypothetical protein [Steroidobacteraceae bacterium]
MPLAKDLSLPADPANEPIPLNADPLESGQVESPSEEDLAALIPDLALLEAAEHDARAREHASEPGKAPAQSRATAAAPAAAAPPAASAPEPAAAKAAALPPHPAPAVPAPARTAGLLHDDPYADMVPEPEIELFDSGASAPTAPAATPAVAEAGVAAAASPAPEANADAAPDLNLAPQPQSGTGTAPTAHEPQDTALKTGAEPGTAAPAPADELEGLDLLSLMPDPEPAPKAVPASALAPPGSAAAADSTSEARRLVPAHATAPAPAAHAAPAPTAHGSASAPAARPAAKVAARPIPASTPAAARATAGTVGKPAAPVPSRPAAPGADRAIRAGSGSVTGPAAALARPMPTARAPVSAPRPAAAPAAAPAARRPASPAQPAGADPSPSDTANIAVPPVMDIEFIRRNKLVERYFAGRLPMRARTVFEQFCREHPQFVDEIGLAERVHAGLRLLEAGGNPEPWAEKPRQLWEHWYVPAALAAAVLILGITALVVQHGSSAKSGQITALQAQLAAQPMDAATTTRTIRLLPSRSGPSPAPAITVGGDDAQFADLRIDLTHSAGKVFRVTIDRLDQGRVAVLNNLEKDSDGALDIGFNTSALGPGTYQFTIEALDWSGQPTPDSWVSIAVAH